MERQNSLLTSLIAYKAWVNNRMYGFLSELPAGESYEERSTWFESIFGTLTHIYIVDDIFRAHLEARPHPYATRAGLIFNNMDELYEA